VLRGMKEKEKKPRQRDACLSTNCIVSMPENLWNGLEHWLRVHGLGAKAPAQNNKHLRKQQQGGQEWVEHELDTLRHDGNTGGNNLRVLFVQSKNKLLLQHQKGGKPENQHKTWGGRGGKRRGSLP